MFVLVGVQGGVGGCAVAVGLVPGRSPGGQCPASAGQGADAEAAEAGEVVACGQEGEVGGDLGQAPGGGATIIGASPPGRGVSLPAGSRGRTP